jgi:hypothetical protein
MYYLSEKTILMINIDYIYIYIIIIFISRQLGHYYYTINWRNLICTVGVEFTTTETKLYLILELWSLIFSNFFQDFNVFPFLYEARITIFKILKLFVGLSLHFLSGLLKIRKEIFFLQITYNIYVHKILYLSYFYVQCIKIIFL